VTGDSRTLLSSEQFQFWAIDHVARTITVVPQEGETVTVPLETERLDNLPDIAHSIFDWEKVWINTITKREDLVVWMGFNPESDDQGPRRPTVYLDQNKWRIVADAIRNPEHIKDAKEREAARELLRYGQDDGVVLPLSGGHLLETSALHSERRYVIGVTIAAVVAGWQMRHPMDVWRQEAVASLGRRLDDVPPHECNERPVVTTEPYAWMENQSGFGLGPAPEGTTDLFFSMLGAPAVMVQNLIDPEPIERVRTRAWVETNARITNQFKSVRLPKAQKRATARRRFWNDNLGVYRAAHARAFGRHDVPTLSDKGLRAFLNEEPMTSLLSELFITRFVDESTRWADNDLIDMLYLACAAAYCDFVVTEKKTGTHLRQIQRSQGKPVTVHTNLQSLVEALHASGVTTDTERRQGLSVVFSNA
jgi:hypothetical protein